MEDNNISNNNLDWSILDDFEKKLEDIINLVNETDDENSDDDSDNEYIKKYTKSDNDNSDNDDSDNDNSDNDDNNNIETEFGFDYKKNKSYKMSNLREQVMEWGLTFDFNNKLILNIEKYLNCLNRLRDNSMTLDEFNNSNIDNLFRQNLVLYFTNPKLFNPLYDKEDLDKLKQENYKLEKLINKYHNLNNILI